MRVKIILALLIALAGQLTAQTLPSYLPSNGLVGYWPFNGNANDESGNGNHGTVNGATLTADRNGNANRAYSFDGIDDELFIPDDINQSGLSQLTINFWVFFDENLNFQSGLAGRNLFSKFQPIGANAEGSFSIYTEYDYDALRFDTRFGPNGSNQMINLRLEPFSNYNYFNTWNNITAVYDGFNNKLYWNGTLVSTSTNPITGLIYPTNYNVSISNAYPNILRLNGKVDDYIFYNRALTQEEITALYTGTSSNNNGGGSGGTAGTPAASVPAGIPYQAVIRDNAGAALVNAPVTVRFTLHQNTTDGAIEFQETQSLTTNAIGLINTQFGSGTATQGTFAGINWSNTTKFIQVEANTGTGYIDMGTQQMMSVPFAYQANKAAAIKNAGLPVYGDNAAALAGGLVPGEMYRTAAGILMIVY